MQVKKPAQPIRIEPRWPGVLAILSMIGLLALLPERIRLVPIWFPYVSGIAVIVPIAAVGLTAAKGRWLRVERVVTLLYVIVVVVGNFAHLTNLISAMVNRSAEVGGIRLLGSSVALWVSNVLVFALLYWQMDRGGPEDRVNNGDTRPDWLFPQEGAPAEDVPPGWRPAFVDYLFLGYSTATAFSTTDVMPLTSRAKMLMMVESSMSLATIVVVGARAINILGS
jgi:uncharacterized membrane protein